MMHNADAHMVHSRLEMFNSNGGHDTGFGDFKLQITSLFMVRNIKCGYSFSKFGREEHVVTKFERIWQNFLFCNKTASGTVSPFK